MSLNLKINWDSKDLKVWRGGEIEKKILAALRVAGNLTLKKLKKSSVEYVLGRKLLKKEVVVGGITTIGTKKRSISELVWVEEVDSKNMPLFKFPHIATALGIGVNVNKGRGMSEIRGSFLARMKSGHIGIFRRKGNNSIRELFSSKLSDVARDDSAILLTQRTIDDNFFNNFTTQMEKK
jgi:hypothetical protein